jgi:hypothetical protein
VLVGRTRLALEVATRLHTARRTPVLWCPVTGPAGGDRLSALVRAAADQLLGASGGAYPGNGTDDIAAFVEIVADRPPLLVLDGVREVAHPGRLVDLLRDCPGLRILVTAAYPLGAPGERPFLLNPLTVPGTCFSYTICFNKCMGMPRYPTTTGTGSGSEEPAQTMNQFRPEEQDYSMCGSDDAPADCTCPVPDAGVPDAQPEPTPSPEYTPYETPTPEPTPSPEYTPYETPY